MKEGEKIIKIVHGSTVFWKPRKKQISWIFKLGKYFEERGCEVNYFTWSGFPLDVFREKIINRFLKELLNDVSDKDNYELYIFAKSYGAEIVERALKKIAKRNNPLFCKVFIRMAGPDPDYHLNIGKLIDVSTKRDYLDPVGTIFARKMYKDKLTRTDNIMKVDFGKLSHKDLNKNSIITSGRYKNRHIYDIYYEFINE